MVVSRVATFDEIKPPVTAASNSLESSNGNGIVERESEAFDNSAQNHCDIKEGASSPHEAAPKDANSQEVSEQRQAHAFLSEYRPASRVPLLNQVERPPTKGRCLQCLQVGISSRLKFDKARNESLQNETSC